MKITKEIALSVAHHKTEQIGRGYEGATNESIQFIMTQGKPIYRFSLTVLKRDQVTKATVLFILAILQNLSLTEHYPSRREIYISVLMSLDQCLSYSGLYPPRYFSDKSLFFSFLSI